MHTTEVIAILSRLQTGLVFSISTGTAEMKLAILALLYCKKFVKTSNVTFELKLYL